MKKNKYTGDKKKFFFCCIIILFIFQLLNIFFLKSETIFIQIIWNITTICGIATGGKVADDFQKSKYFNSELNGGGNE